MWKMDGGHFTGMGGGGFRMRIPYRAVAHSLGNNSRVEFIDQNNRETFRHSRSAMTRERETF